jgi:hypothetical protein
VSERLGMGDESRVTQAIGRLKRKGPPELERLKRRLEQVYEDRSLKSKVQSLKLGSGAGWGRRPAGLLGGIGRL